MKPTERYEVKAYYPGEKIPLNFVTFQRDVLESEIKDLKELGYELIEVNGEKYP